VKSKAVGRSLRAEIEAACKREAAGSGGKLLGTISEIFRLRSSLQRRGAKLLSGSGVKRSACASVGPPLARRKERKSSLRARCKYTPVGKIAAAAVRLSALRRSIHSLARPPPLPSAQPFRRKEHIRADRLRSLSLNICPKRVELPTMSRSMKLKCATREEVAAGAYRRGGKRNPE